ncbi:hypothetical protein KFL_001260030 [Klebsormidium nitens]|uniref:Uncharacterized protein n=1 Tax=Klebsormidium nitens TaxID=105231 RepID=A0A1Y1HXE9_KLENI|nr:hypothetical protein KFL_001260030 [Klebsormidium nitens]|eukprot:GAQ82833.1 hypothetical protein KFL_001260030 [Klebsormidium nitens]
MGDCSPSDQCLTFDTSLDFEVVNPASTTRPSPAAAIWIEYNAKKLTPPADPDNPYTINALGLTFHYSKESEAVGSTTVMVPVNAYNKITLLVQQQEHVNGDTTIRFEPSVTSSALVDLRYNGLGDRAEAVVGGFTNDSLTYVKFDLDRRGVEIIEETAAFSIATLVSQYGGFWSYIGLIFGVIFVVKETQEADLNEIIDKVLRLIFRGNHNSVKPAEGLSKTVAVAARKVLVGAFVEGQELVNELNAPNQFAQPQSGSSKSTGPRAETTLADIRANLQKHQE